MESSYLKEDVTILLKNITGMVEGESTTQREQQIQQGKHYSEMLPIEYEPTQQYYTAFQNALDNFSQVTADGVGVLSHKLHQKMEGNLVLVSLARAGLPAGILVKRYFKQFFHMDIPHYSISIIRGRGIDHVSMDYILSRHQPEELVFIDGWIGKGAILGELQKEMQQYPKVSTELAVIADPANVTSLFGTQEDILIPSACLNATVSGLISRTFLRDDIIQKGDFHGSVFYKELKNADVSYTFIEKVQSFFKKDYHYPASTLIGQGIEEVKKLANEYQITDINHIKPGIGETTRVLLRRVPWKIIINTTWKDSPDLTHIYRLAEERQVALEYKPLTHYKVCGIIKKLGDI